MGEVAYLEHARQRKANEIAAGQTLQAEIQSAHSVLQDRLLRDRGRTAERRIPGKIVISHLNHPLQQAVYETTIGRTDMIRVCEVRRWRNQFYLSLPEDPVLGWSGEAEEEFLIFDNGRFVRYKLNKPRTTSTEDLAAVRQTLAVFAPENPVVTPLVLDSFDRFQVLTAPYLASESGK